MRHRVRSAWLPLVVPGLGGRETDDSRKVTEAALAHVVQNKVDGVDASTRRHRNVPRWMMEGFRRGRDFSAWLGLVPRQHSTGGKPRLGKISKMGQRDLRRLLVVGAMTRVNWAVRRGATKDPWLARMLARKPRMLVAVALANRMARIAWALMTKTEHYRARTVTA